MKIILKETVQSLGEPGDIVTVKSGYGRNYLIPKGLGILANDNTIRITQKMIEEKEIKDANTKKGLQLIADKLNSLKLKFSVKSGEDDKLFGSVTTQMLSEELMNQGYKVDKKYISLSDPIKALGNYFADVDFGEDVKAKIKIKVIAEE